LSSLSKSNCCCLANVKNWNWTSFDWLLTGTYWKSSFNKSSPSSSSSLGSYVKEICVSKLDVDAVVVGMIGLGDVECWCSSLDANLSQTWLHVTVVWIGDGVVGLTVLE
jgi:hypothetical protein